MVRKRHMLVMLIGAFAVYTISAAVTPALATKTDLAPTTEQSLLADAIGGRCIPSPAMDVLRSYRLKILNAATVEEARAFVLSQTGLARKALSTASWLLPSSSSVREARDKVGDLEQRVYAANTQSEVASDFSEFLTIPADPRNSMIVDPEEADSSLMVLAENNLDSPAVRLGTNNGGGCNYTTGEVIIIILGFLLFIIPGIIFLIIFC